ncbi:hypothetical protein IAD21_06320 [Abditibacteriota bacterium]|nr:hypothetical protein IAD21_06320 [Abditibacteriota bacterium]
MGCAAAFGVGTVPALAQAPPPSWDVYADTWVATDGLGRSLPTTAHVGSPRPNRDVGIFYFLWLGREELDSGPYNITQILQKDPTALQHADNPAWGGKYSFHHWDEPIWGYYNNADPAILRKHAEQLSAAGVDMLLFDTSNGYNYPEVVNAITKVYLEMQREGMKVPKLAFHTVASSGEKQVKQVQDIYELFYKSGANDSLWYKWNGKPLIIADPNQTFSEGIGNYFTFRKSYWGGKNPGPGSWDTDGVYPSGEERHIQKDALGNIEEMAVPVASSIIHSPVSSMGPGTGRSWHKSQKEGYRDTAPNAIAHGIQFQDNWDYALKKSPPFILTYSWNEWIVQKFIYPDGSAYFVDQFTDEFSKDIEPMKGGFGDAYYYQLVDNVRRYKGARALPPISRAKIALKGDWTSWQTVGPEFRDTIFDPMQREFKGYNPKLHYTNTTGRNDIKLAKAALSGKNLAFYVQTREKLSVPSGPDWMTLYVDADQNAKTGWLGYDYRISPTRKVIERNVGGTYQWGSAQPISTRVGDNAIALLVSLKQLGLGANAHGVDFKWTDNCFEKGDWSDFMLNGDAAPNDRFNYHAQW